jgi:glycosyltransferase involved in cell wall biosynthesis
VSDAPVSVIIPTFRDGEVLRRALNSVASQTLQPAEVIVIDDAGGVQVTSQICADSPARSVRLIGLPKNVGPGGARNAGIAASRQTFLAFLDADDEWHPEKLHRQMSLMLASDAIGLTAHGKGFDADAWQSLPSHSPTKPIGRWSMLLSNPAAISTVVIRRDAINHLFPLWYAVEDYAFVAANLLSGIGGLKMAETLGRADRPAFGAGGLSGRLLSMQAGEMRTHFYLWRTGLITSLEYLPLIPWSLAKYVRRLVLVAGRRLLRRNNSAA